MPLSEGCFVFCSFQFHYFDFNFGTFHETSETFTFLLSRYCHHFRVFVYLFGGIVLPAYSYEANQTRSNALLNEHSAKLVPSVWISSFAIACVLWMAITPSVLWLPWSSFIFFCRE